MILWYWVFTGYWVMLWCVAAVICVPPGLLDDPVVLGVQGLLGGNGGLVRGRGHLRAAAARLERRHARQLQVRPDQPRPRLRAVPDTQLRHLLRVRVLLCPARRHSVLLRQDLCRDTRPRAQEQGESGGEQQVGDVDDGATFL